MAPPSRARGRPKRNLTAGEAMIVINMPGGAIQNIAEGDLLWFRNAFASEWKGATMLRLGGDRIYSIEPIDDLSEKFTASGVSLATFSAPDARMKLIVNGMFGR
jgi:hypothetical protein